MRLGVAAGKAGASGDALFRLGSSTRHAHAVFAALLQQPHGDITWVVLGDMEVMEMIDGIADGKSALFGNITVKWMASRGG